MSPTWSARTDCRLCGGSELSVVLDYGLQPLANAFLADGHAAPSVPLSLCRCGRCGLVQVPQVVDPTELFAAYAYVSGTSPAMLRHWEDLAAAVAARHPGGRVLEIASNDGTHLAAMARAGLTALGVDPARNLAAEANAAGRPTVAAFFDRALGPTLAREHGPFDAVVACNVLAHVDDPVGLLAGAREALAPGGHVVIEVPGLAELVAAGAFDTVYHEHLSVFSVPSLLAAAEAAGLGAVGLSRVPVHGGSLRLWLQPGADHADDVRRAAAAEEGLATGDGLAPLVAHAHAVRRALRDRCAVAPLPAYGAAAKATVLVHWCGLDVAWIPWIGDANPRKQGARLPGTAIPVVPPEHLVAAAPPAVLLCAWNHATELAPWLARHGVEDVVLPHALGRAAGQR